MNQPPPPGQQPENDPMADPTRAQPPNNDDINPYGDVTPSAAPQTSAPQTWQAPPPPPSQQAAGTGQTAWGQSTWGQTPLGNPAGSAGQQAPDPQAAIQQYKVKSRRAPAIIIAVVAALVVAILVTLAVRSPELSAEDIPSSSAPSGAGTSASPAAGASTPAGTITTPTNTIPVIYNSFEGQWTITDATWDATGLSLTMEITATKGSLDFTFFALDDSQGSTQYSPTGTWSEASITAPNTASGSVRFTMPRQDVMVIIASQTGRAAQITAIAVPA